VVCYAALARLGAETLRALSSWLLVMGPCCIRGQCRPLAPVTVLPVPNSGPCREYSQGLFLIWPAFFWELDPSQFGVRLGRFIVARSVNYDNPRRSQKSACFRVAGVALQIVSGWAGSEW